MIRLTRIIVLLAVGLLGACEVTADVGAGSCLDVRLPSGDCTSREPPCTECLYQCNSATRHCIPSPPASCVGTPCVVDSDCALGEGCNSATRTCFAFAGSQRCMPCKRDWDCGSGSCLDGLCTD